MKNKVDNAYYEVHTLNKPKAQVPYYQDQDRTTAPHIGSSMQSSNLSSTFLITSGGVIFWFALIMDLYAGCKTLKTRKASLLDGSQHWELMILRLNTEEAHCMGMPTVCQEYQERSV